MDGDSAVRQIDCDHQSNNVRRGDPAQNDFSTRSMIDQSDMNSMRASLQLDRNDPLGKRNYGDSMLPESGSPRHLDTGYDNFLAQSHPNKMLKVEASPPQPTSPVLSYLDEMQENESRDLSTFNTLEDFIGTTKKVDETLFALEDD